MYKKSILNEYSFILPKKLVVSDAELYKRRKENLSVLPNYVNYAVPSNWFGYLKVSKIFLVEESLKTLRTLTIALSEKDVSDHLLIMIGMIGILQEKYRGLLKVLMKAFMAKLLLLNFHSHMKHLMMKLWMHLKDCLELQMKNS